MYENLLEYNAHQILILVLSGEKEEGKGVE